MNAAAYGNWRALRFQPRSSWPEKLFGLWHLMYASGGGSLSRDGAAELEKAKRIAEQDIIKNIHSVRLLFS